MQEIKSKKISVIIPIYNHEKFIVSCLDSIKNQIYTDIEIILIDDGSIDKSYETALGWVNENNKLFSCIMLFKQENQGITKTLNRLIEKSTGDIIYPLASDDYLPMPQTLGDIVAAFENYGNRPILMFYEVYLANITGQIILKNTLSLRQRYPISLERSQTLLKLEILLRWGLPFMHQCMNRKFLDEFKNYDEQFKFEDMDSAFFACAKNYAKFNNIIGKVYRIRVDGSQTISQTTTPGLCLSDLDRGLIYKKYSKFGLLFFNLICILQKAYYKNKKNLVVKIIRSFLILNSKILSAVYSK